MKKSKLFIFALCLLLTALFTVCISAATYGDLTYSVSNGEVTITDCNTFASGALIIPAEIDGYPVTSIGVGAFNGCSYLDNITIPSTVTSMGEEEFEEAFIDCSRLTSITVDAANPNYSSDAQGVLYNKTKTTLICCPAGTPLTSVTIPSSVTTIGFVAFYGCSGLTSIIIPSSVTSIREQAFSGCRNLTSIEIPSSVTSIEAGAFASCGLTSITIPSSVTLIDYHTFWGCSSLTSITIPSSVTSIGELAFAFCGLTSVEIPASVTQIDGAFAGCDNLTSITIWNAHCAGIGYDGSLPFPKSAVIYGRSGSWTREYANECGLAFAVATCAHPAVYRDALVEIPATCTEAGSRTYNCLMCGDAVEEIIPASHDYVLTLTAKAPTCTENGVGRYTCTRCEGTKVDVLPATGHTEVEIPAVPATCTTDGTTADIICSICGAVLSAPTVIPALGHSEVALAAIPASCTESGLTAGVKCSVCNEILVAQVVIPALGHDYQITETYLEASCTVAGIAAYTCTRCGDVTYDDIPKVSALALSGVYTNGEGDLRFVTRVTSTAGDPEIEYFGTYIVPLSYFTAHELNAGGGEQPGVAAVKYTQSIENGASFAADLTDIPGTYFDTPIFAWSFVKFQGIDAVYTQVLGSFTVSGARLVKGGF